jgi:putative transposase
MGDSLTLKIRQNEVFALPDGMYRFALELQDRVLLFVRHGTGKEQPIHEDEFVAMIGRGEVARMRDRSDRAASAPEPDEVSPDEKPHEVLRARTLQFFTRMHDADTSVGFGDVGLQKHINRHRKQALELGLTHDVLPATLRRAIKGCGAPGARYLKYFVSRRGRTSRARLHFEIADLLDGAVRFYWNARARDKLDAWAFFKAELKTLNEERGTAGLDPLKSPKDAVTLYRRINDTICHENWKTKYSLHEANQKFKGVSPHLDAKAPGEVIIIDHTVVDTWVLLDDNGIPLGRPTLTLAIDVYSRCVVGFLISAEPPSVYSIGTVLKHVMMPKDYVTREYPDIKRRYDCWLLPEIVLIDNAYEHLSGSLRDAGQDIGFEVLYSPIHSPGHKSIGEKAFDTINRLLHKLPAAVPYDVTTMRKARLDPRTERPVFLRDLEYFVHKHLIDEYHYRYHEGLKAIPARIWDEGVQRSPREFVDDFEAIDQILGKVDEATISRAGVRYKNMRFHDAELTTQILDDMVRLQPVTSQSKKTYGQARARIKLKYNPADASQIQVWNEGAEPKHYVTLPNVDANMARGLSFWAAERVREYARELDLEYATEDERLLARDALRREWEAMAQATPRRTGADARRGIAQETPTVIEGVVNFAKAAPSVYGNAQPVDLPALTRANSSEKPVSSLRGGKKTKEKIRKAARRRKAEATSQEAGDRETSAPSDRSFFLPAAVRSSNPYDLDKDWK